MAKVLPELNLDSVKLDDALDFMRDVVPEFKTVVVRDKGVPEDYPTVKLRLKNVTLGQVWSVLQAANPDLEVRPVGENQGPWPIYLVRVKAPPPDGTPAGPQVLVYPLGPIVDAMTAKPGKEAGHGNDPLADILSLIKAALAQVPSRSDPVLQVHLETRTLIFKGTADQAGALTQVLKALPRASAELAEVRDAKQRADGLQDELERNREQFTVKIQQLQADADELHQRLRLEEQKSLTQVLEAEKLKVRLEEQTELTAGLKKRLADQTEELTRLKDQAAHH